MIYYTKIQLFILSSIFSLQTVYSQELNTMIQSSEINRLVKDSCDKEVVLLGEDSNHGGGTTISIKAELVKRLIDDCDFSAVLFESPVYEFIDFEHSVANKTATINQLANSIGGLWSFNQESEGLIQYLFTQSQLGKIQLAGLDLQTGGITSTFTKEKLSKVLTQTLSIEPRKICQTILNRHFNWYYDENNPFNESSKKALKHCADLITDSLKNSTLSNEIKLMASNFTKSLEMMQGNSFNIRDAQMYENFKWFKSKLPQKTKVIVWSATIHAIKQATQISDKIKPMGVFIHEAFKSNAIVVGFSAFSGHYYDRVKQKTIVIDSVDGSLESLAFNTNSLKIKYLNNNQLKSLDKISAKAINYSKPKSIEWYKLIDSLVVLKQETVPHSSNKFK